MYMDAIVIATIVAVLMVLGLSVGVAVFVVRDQKAHTHSEVRKSPPD